MALPSSPPSLPDTDLPLSPTLLPTSSNLPAGALDRKRQRSDYGSLSSDPIFSDSTSDADDRTDGERPKRKRLFKGPWWSAGKQSTPDLRRSMAVKGGLKGGSRNADSGVWMGSDSSDSSIDSLAGSQQRMQGLAVEDMAPESTVLADTAPDREQLAVGIVQHCLDNGKEAVDLSGLGLTALAEDTLGSLHQLIRHTFADFDHPPSEDEFTPLTPAIQLYLSGNRLKSLPIELFRLTNISVLSLRNNELSCLPPAIARLHKLTELNISGNYIRHLPWEFLDIVHCRSQHHQITIRPNPLIAPVGLSGPSPLTKAQLTRVAKGEDWSRFGETRLVYENMRQKCWDEGGLDMRGELELRLKLGRMLRTQHFQEVSRAGGELELYKDELIYLASSAVRYFGADGSVIRQGTRVLSLEQDYTAVLEPTINAPADSRSGTVPSIFELALRGVQTHYKLRDLLPHLDKSDLSSRITSAIRTAARNVAEHGNEHCSTCGRAFVVARAQWMEYWFHGSSSQALTSETVLPFLRRTCSWACAQPSEIGTFRC